MSKIRESFDLLQQYRWFITMGYIAPKEELTLEETRYYLRQIAECEALLEVIDEYYREDMRRIRRAQARLMILAG